MSVYLEKMAEFSTLLRSEGLAVGLQETADACKLLSDLNLEDRSTVRLALQAVYAKSREEQAIFQRAFDGFFVSAEKRDAFRRQREEEARELAQRRAEAEAEMQVNGQPMDLREDLRESGAILKKPSIAETLDWVSALEALGVSDLTPEAARQTVGFVLKSSEDMEAAGPILTGQPHACGHDHENCGHSHGDCGCHHQS